MLQQVELSFKVMEGKAGKPQAGDFTVAGDQAKKEFCHFWSFTVIDCFTAPKACWELYKTSETQSLP